MTQNPIRLDDLLERNLAVQWFEGVAVIQAVCRAVSGSGPGFPSARNILLARDGSVSLLGTPTADGVGTAAHLLAQMLSDDVPVRLRLVVTQATGSDGAYSSLAEFSEALAYFERPDSEHVLRGLHERAAMASPRTEPRPSLEPAKTVREDRKSEPRPRPQKGVSRAAVLALAVAAIACAAVWAVGSESANGSIKTALDTLKQAVAPSEPTTHEPVEKDKPSAKASTRRKHGAAPAFSSAAANTKTSEGRRDEPKLAPATAFLPMLSFTAPDLAVMAGDIDLAADVEPIVVVASGVNAVRAARTEGGRLYSAADPRVKPPRHVYPKLPEDLPPPTSLWGDRTILDLVVATDGMVERVKLRSPPRDIHEFMLLSAAKAWRFEPARIGGRPVRFLYSVPIGEHDPRTGKSLN